MRDALRLLSGECLESGNHVEEFLIDAFLPKPVILAIEVVKHAVDAFLGALHGCKTARVLTGKGFCAGLKQQNK